MKIRSAVGRVVLLVFLGLGMCSAALAQAPAAERPADANHAVSTPESNAQPPPLGDEPSAATGTAALLPKDLSPWGMFLSAAVVVKGVMIGLALASLVTWTIALAKGFELLTSRLRLRRELRVLARLSSLPEAGKQFGQRQSLAPLIRAAILEVHLSADTSDKEGVKERIASRLERIEAGVGRLRTRGTGLLASIGATAPFVGLFGTVWGIMNSFIGISKQHTTNLAVVAPGIAEALLATALGLAAAIPAVVIYNVFSRSIAGYRALFADAAAEVLRLASRDLDRHAESTGAWRAEASAAE